MLGDNYNVLNLIFMDFHTLTLDEYIF